MSDFADAWAAHVSHVITSGTPNHGVFAIPTVQPDGEFDATPVVGIPPGDTRRLVSAEFQRE